MKYFILNIILILTTFRTFAQDYPEYVKHLYIAGNDTLPFRILLPENYKPSEKYPLIIFLHGAGERGNDNTSQLRHGAQLFLKPETRKKYPAIVVFPQCPANSYWSNVEVRMENNKRAYYFKPDGEPTVAMKLLEGLIGKLKKDYSISNKQMYVGGLSMGGMGTFEVVRRNPAMFAAAFPICGGANPATAHLLRKVNWWIFHGAKDGIVNPSFSKNMVMALEAERIKVKFTLYPEANHNSWDSAFAEPGLMEWLFSQKK
jgi:predicted peptidase